MIKAVITIATHSIDNLLSTILRCLRRPCHCTYVPPKVFHGGDDDFGGDFSL